MEASPDLRNTLEKLSHELFPLARSIAGPALRESLKIVGQHLPFELIEIPSGTSVFDWTVPQEWNLVRGVIRDMNGKVVLDSENSNLHVLNYSDPIRGKSKGKELKEHIYTLPENPEVIPYRTSFYEPRWGFCMAHQEAEKLDLEGEYEYFIEASKYEGSLTIGDCTLPGSSAREVIFTAYLCHPSMAVNELSGPLTLVALYRLIRELPDRRLSYRFVVSAETIGAISYIANRGLDSFQNMVGGVAFQMTGLDAPLVTRPAHRASALDKALRKVIEAKGRDFAHQLHWSPSGGGDQRQWTSMGVRLPMSYVSRTILGGYPEYHTSADNLELLSFEKVLEAADTVFAAVKTLELETFPNYVGPPCEPFLSKYGLQTTLGGPRASDELTAIKLILGNADGATSLEELSEKESVDIQFLQTVFEKLVNAGLVSD